MWVATHLEHIWQKGGGGKWIQSPVLWIHSPVLWILSPVWMFEISNITSGKEIVESTPFCKMRNVCLRPLDPLAREAL
jgi:hypothetical protein